MATGVRPFLSCDENHKNLSEFLFVDKPGDTTMPMPQSHATEKVPIRKVND